MDSTVALDIHNNLSIFFFFHAGLVLIHLFVVSNIIIIAILLILRACLRVIRTVCKRSACVSVKSVVRLTMIG